MVNYAEEFQQMEGVTDRLVQAARATVVFIVEHSGQVIAASGEVEQLATTALGPLCGGHAQVLARGLQEQQWVAQVYPDQQASLYLEVVHQRTLLVVIFPRYVELARVRQSARQAGQALLPILAAMDQKAQGEKQPASLPLLSAAAIDNLFR